MTHRDPAAASFTTWAVAVVLLSLAAACSKQAPSSTPPATLIPSPAAVGDGRPTSAVVVQVLDAVTIEVEFDGQRARVRYLGLELPDGGAGATLLESGLQFNRFLVEGKVVELEEDRVDKDSSGNLLRYVYAGGELANEALLTNGYAVVAGFPNDFRRKTDFTIAQEDARREQRGYWEPRPTRNSARVTPAAVAPFSGGTLPAPPNGAAACEFSGTPEAVIKGNVDALSGNRTYHVPGSLFYRTTVVSEQDGDRWFCTEADARAAGWTKSKR